MSWSHAACNDFDKPFPTIVFVLVHISRCCEQEIRVFVTSGMQCQSHVCREPMKCMLMLFMQVRQRIGLCHVWHSSTAYLQVNLKLFTPAPNRRRTVLLFVFRDMTTTPLQQLKATWEEDLQRMWYSITKPPHYDAYSFSDFFEVTKIG